MEPTIRIPDTRTTGANTGKFENFLQPDLMVFDILLPEGQFIPLLPSQSDISAIADSVRSYLKGRLIANDPLIRARLIGPYESFEDKSEEPTLQVLGYGKEVETSRGVYKWMHTYDEGGLDYHLKVKTYKGKIRKYRLIRVDAKGVVYGTYHYDSTTGEIDGLQGFKLSRFDPMDWKLPNKTTEAVFGVYISLANSVEWNEGLFALDGGQDLKSYLENLSIQDIDLHTYTALAASTMTISAFLGGVNIAEEMPEFADPGNFIATNKGSGGTIAITSVTIANGRFSVLLDSMDPNYVPLDKVLLKTASVSALAANGFEYYESNTIEDTMD